MSDQSHTLSAPDPSPARSTLLDRDDLLALFDGGRLTRDQLHSALRLLRDDAGWAHWMRLLLLGMGLTLVLCGIGFVVAANWTGLTAFDRVKLGLGGVAVAALLAAALGDNRAGRAAQVAAAALVGPLLALIGQAWQTGAEAWLLFAAWAGLILPWAITAISPVLWVLWLAIVQIAVYLANDSRGWLFDDRLPGTLAVCAVLSLLGLAGAESQRGRRLGPPWARVLCLAAALIELTPAGLDMIFDSGQRSGGTIFGFLLALATIGFGAWYYRLRRPDLAALALVALAAAGMASCLWVRLWIETTDVEFFSFWIIGGGIVGIFAAAAVWLQKTRKAFAEVQP